MPNRELIEVIVVHDFLHHVDDVQIEGKIVYLLQLTMQFLSASAAAALDKDLMSTGAFSIDQ